MTDIADERGRELAATLKRNSSEYYRLDVRQETEWSTVIDHISSPARQLDVVVNSAGIPGFEGADRTADPGHDLWQTGVLVLATNLDRTSLGTDHALRAMRSQQGSLRIRCPAAILTPMWVALLGSGEERELRLQAVVKDTPLRRFVMPTRLQRSPFYSLPTRPPTSPEPNSTSMADCWRVQLLRQRGSAEA